MALSANKLSKKDYDTFRDMVNFYETNKFSKGLKLAEKLLEKYPNHGETEAMKGLMLTKLGKRDEGFEFVKLGLKHDLKSSVCWHVYGLVYKSDNNYKEAIKCYLNALKFDPDSQLILKDLGSLQVQMRDTAGFKETRSKILGGRPANRASWVGFAVANYLNGDYDTAFSNITNYHETITEKGDAYEESELILFQCKCLEQANRYAQALEHLKIKDDLIVDKFFSKIKTAELLVLQQKYDLALEKWSALVIEQSENYRLHAGLQVALLKLKPKVAKEMFQLKRLELPCTVLPLTTDEKKAIYLFYNNMNLKSRAFNRIKLDLVDGDEFNTLLKDHMKKSIDGGIPALYEIILSLARMPNPISGRLEHTTDPTTLRTHPVIVKTLSLVDLFIQNLSFGGTFESESSEVKQSPNSLLWAKFLKCQLLDSCGYYSEALSLIEECIEHTPTGLDMYMKKASILSKTGQLNFAANVMDYCRSLDLQDRFLNNETTKYLLQVNRIEDAMKTIAMFTKHDGDPEQTLFELQCSWYELEIGEAYARVGSYGPALKKFYALLKHFNDYVEDMFDFHGYCIRKTTLRMYTDLLRTQDEQYSHRFYQRAFQGAVKLLLHLKDHPEAIPETKPEEPSNLAAPTSDSVVKTVESAPSSSSASKDKDNKDKDDDEDEPPKKVDDDPKGDKLMRKDLLNEANIWCSHLETRIHVCQPETVVLYAEVKMRRNEASKAIQALKSAWTQYSSSPVLLEGIIRLSLAYKDKMGTLDEATLSAWDNLLTNKSLEELSSQYLNSTVITLKLVAVKSLDSLGLLNDAAVNDLINSLKGSDFIPYSVVKQVYEYGKDSELVNNIVSIGKGLYQHADIFKTNTELLEASTPLRMDLLPSDDKEVANQLTVESS